MEWEDSAGKERGDEKRCEWQQQSTEIKSSNREGDLGLWEKERGSQKTCSWDGEKAVTKRNLGTTGTCHAEVLSWGKEESLNQQILNKHLHFKMPGMQNWILHAGAPRCYKPSHYILRTTSPISAARSLNLQSAVPAKVQFGKVSKEETKSSWSINR